MKIPYLQPPTKLGEGFLNFAKEIHQKSVELGTKFTEEELAEFFNQSFSGKVRANFLLWIGDLNRIIEGINIMLGDLNQLKSDRHSMTGDPVIRSEFLFQSFFGEFFRLKEICKLFIKQLAKIKVLSNKNKEMLYDSYFTAFDWIYEIRNMMIHQGVTFKNYDVKFPEKFMTGLDPHEAEIFTKLVETSNTRQGTVEVQCAFYIWIISELMEHYLKFQHNMGDTLAELVLLYEDFALDITVSRND
ncbi:hypothetical protein ASE74_24140 [Pedobacter sp. Leaf216]|uniref:hypothetical protein n=1 Tax=Pedobacter sp. Leaf216 TaxID=1735684 RepID=UPI0006F6D859|nr:hypothetical protein [Pedobacter sp. Leaf216]KQM68210.1 hypothetical protein ASE74_24140 [Pedobacter sp. Leaf216]